MIRNNLRYHRPDSASEVTHLLAEYGEEAMVLGGGTMLVPQLTRAERRCRHVVDLRGLGLDTVKRDGDTVTIGAMVTYGTILRTRPSGDVTDLLFKVAKTVTGGCQIRNQATLGGSSAYANPSSDIPGCLVALRAEMVIIGSGGSRIVSADDFFVDAFTTALRPGEFLAGMRIRLRKAHTSYVKIKAASSGWPVVGVSAIRDTDAGTLRIAVGAAQSIPVAMDVTHLVGPDRGPEYLVDAVRSQIVSPIDDAQGSARYRRHVAGVLARRAIEGLGQ